MSTNVLHTDRKFVKTKSVYMLKVAVNAQTVMKKTKKFNGQTLNIQDCNF